MRRCCLSRLLQQVLESGTNVNRLVHADSVEGRFTMSSSETPRTRRPCSKSARYGIIVIDPAIVRNSARRYTISDGLLQMITVNHCLHWYVLAASTTRWRQCLMGSSSDRGWRQRLSLSRCRSTSNRTLAVAEQLSSPGFRVRVLPRPENSGTTMQFLESHSCRNGRACAGWINFRALAELRHNVARPFPTSVFAVLLQNFFNPW